MLQLTCFGGQGARAYFIHGFGADAQSWVANVGAVSASVEAIGIDLPAHGLSAGVDVPDTLSQVAEQVIDSIDTSSPCILIGHSAGGAIAMLCAAKIPVSAVGLVSPVGLGAGPDLSFLHQLPRVESESQAISLLQTMVINKRLIANPVATGLLKQLQVPGIRERWQRFADLLVTSENELQDARLQLVRQHIPVQVVWGNDDRINRLDESAQQHLPGDWHLFDNCGHLPHIEQWSAYNKALIKLINSGS